VAFHDWWFVPRILTDVSGGSQKMTLLGREVASPFGIAPMGISALSAYRGDLVLAGAAGEAGIPMIMSSSSLIPLEDLAREHPHAWFQAYLPGDVDEIKTMVARVARAGFTHFVVTVDSQVSPNREHYVRGGFSFAASPQPGPLLARYHASVVDIRHVPAHAAEARHAALREQLRAPRPPILSANVTREWSDRGRLDWTHLAMIRELWKGPLIVKGILHVDDARRARDSGRDAIILSNHGGRQLDGAIAPLRVLPEVVAACPGYPVMLDGGVRRGTDVLKALALGAAFVWIGRPFNYAASIGGHDGVRHAITLLRAEIERDMMMLGIRALDELGPHAVKRVDGTGIRS
jgi:L-lactate dehydrogenase (cytochrome)